MTDNGWTVPVLRAHVEQLLSERDQRYNQQLAAQERAVSAALDAANKAVSAAMAAADKATAKAEDESKEWRRGANEWRAAMNDREKQFLPRTEAAAEIRRLNEKFEELASRVTRAEGQGAGTAATWTVVIAVAGVLLAVGTLLAVVLSR